MQELVTYHQEAAYVRDSIWPWNSLTIACSSLLEYNTLLERAQNFLEASRASEGQNMEVQPTSEDEPMQSSDEEVLFANEEED
eukprot:4407698-Amphidinium_carterae.1